MSNRIRGNRTKDEDYVSRILAQARTGKLAPTINERGRVKVVEVQHDADCPRTRGGTCNCNPIILFAPD